MPSGISILIRIFWAIMSRNVQLKLAKTMKIFIFSHNWKLRPQARYHLGHMSSQTQISSSSLLWPSQPWCPDEVCALMVTDGHRMASAVPRLHI